MRKIGVEEELLLVDPVSGELRSVAAHVLREHRDTNRDTERATERDTEGEGGHAAPDELEGELLAHMLETHTDPLTDLGDVAGQILAARRTAAVAARAAGVALAAVGVPPLSTNRSRVSRNPRYERIVQEFGDTGLGAGALGMHVHVDVVDDEEAVRVVDGLRAWLPVVVALAANSPYAESVDTGYASWRQRVWARWPSAGQSEPYGTAAEYRRVAAAMIESGAALDPGMLYLDARLAADYPTVEIRVADVCTEMEDAVLVAALCRSLVETAARESVPSPVRSDLLRAAHWRAARYGLSSDLVHPTSGHRVPAHDAVAALVDHVASALDEAGDRSLVDVSLRRLWTVGGGARRQRQAFERTGSIEGVVRDLVVRTEEAT